MPICTNIVNNRTVPMNEKTPEYFTAIKQYQLRWPENLEIALYGNTIQ